MMMMIVIMMMIKEAIEETVNALQKNDKLPIGATCFLGYSVMLVRCRNSTVSIWCARSYQKQAAIENAATPLLCGRVTTTTESSTNGAATLSRMIFFIWIRIRHVTIFS